MLITITRGWKTMAIKRFFNDIWFTLKGCKNVWRIQRMMSKEQQRLTKLCKEIGPIGVFLQNFEEIPIDDPNEQVIKIIMLTEFSQFVKEMDEEDIVKEDLETFYTYCNKYDIEC